jgi:hypothetical protein
VKKNRMKIAGLALVLVIGASALIAGTPSVCPRANNEGYLGTATRQWQYGYIQNFTSTGGTFTCAAMAVSGDVTLSAGSDIQIGGHLNVSSNGYVGGTMAITGVVTLTAMAVCNGGLDVNEDVDIDLNAADEEINITQASAAGTADVPLFKISDARTGATANTTNEASIVIDAEGVYGMSIIDGGLSVEGASIFDSAITASADIDCDEIDSETATTLELGKATATSVVIADAGVDTDIEGPLNLEGSLIGDVTSIANAAGVYTNTLTATCYTFDCSAITTQRFANGTAGQVAVFKNNAATNVYIDVAAGDVTLGDNDTVILGYLGSEWITMITQNN